jgi:CRP-like cAMP-binding protein
VLIVERVAALHRIDLFAATPGHVLAAVAADAEELTLDTGETLIEQGAFEDCFYAILTGRVQVLVGDRVLVEAGPGSTVGELAVLVPEARSTTVVTLMPSGFLRVRKAIVDDLVTDHPAFARSIIEALVARLRATSAHLQATAAAAADLQSA